jgi:CRP-like cAMP-binding protein
MAIQHRRSFDPKTFLAKGGEGRSIGRYSENEIVYAQGDPTDSVFYIQEGHAKHTVVSGCGKEVVVAVLGVDDFFGEGCLAGQTQRTGTVVSMTHSVIVRLEKAAMIQVMHEEPAFSEKFIAYILGQTIRNETDLFDHLFSASEKRVS